MVQCTQHIQPASNQALQQSTIKAWTSKKLIRRRRRKITAAATWESDATADWKEENDLCSFVHSATAPCSRCCCFDYFGRVGQTGGFCWATVDVQQSGAPCYCLFGGGMSWWNPDKWTVDAVTTSAARRLGLFVASFSRHFGRTCRWSLSAVRWVGRRYSSRLLAQPLKIKWNSDEAMLRHGSHTDGHPLPLLFRHFYLACIHNRTSVRTKTMAGRGLMIARPFCNGPLNERYITPNGTWSQSTAKIILFSLTAILFHFPLVLWWRKTNGFWQVWQRDRAKFDTFSINVQSYSQNHKIAFLGHPMGTSDAIQALYMNVLMQRNFVAELHRQDGSFTGKTAI